MKGNILRDLLVAIVVSAIAIAAILWVPNQGGYSFSIKEKLPAGISSFLQKKEARASTPQVSYNDPRVQSTLDVPWAREGYRSHR